MKLDEIGKGAISAHRRRIGAVPLDLSKYISDKGDLRLSNLHLKTLVGCPAIVKKDFDCSHNELTSFARAPREIGGHVTADHNNISSLHDVHLQIRKMSGWMTIDCWRIKSHVLGLLLIKGLLYVRYPNRIWAKIINEHLPNERGMAAVYDCQEKMLELDHMNKTSPQYKTEEDLHLEELAQL